MNVNEIRRLAQQRPFKPLLFQLDNGTKQLIKHPEIIITEVVIMAADDKGFPVIIAPEAVTSIHYAPAKAHRARIRRKPVTAKK